MKITEIDQDILVLYQDEEDLEEALERFKSQADDWYYNEQRKLLDTHTETILEVIDESIISDISYRFFKVSEETDEQLKDVSGSLCGIEIHGLHFLSGDYSSKILNYIITRVRG